MKDVIREMGKKVSEMMFKIYCKFEMNNKVVRCVDIGE